MPTTKPSLWTASALSLLLVLCAQVDGRPLTVRVNRWLELRTVQGSVQLVKNGQTSTAQVGQRLSAVGDGVRTGASSAAVLAVDTEVGFVTVAENTSLRVSRLEATSTGGRITHLAIDRGQARLQVRPFTHPDSELELETPAGVTGVRGTIFGVAVQPTGRSSVATLEGNVISSAQGETVMVPAGFQSLTIPGEPPQPPVPLKDDPFLDIRVLRRGASVDNQRFVQVIGNTDPVNLIVVNEVVQPTSRVGDFDLQLPIPENYRILVTVITPLGTQQAYELVVP